MHNSSFVGKKSCRKVDKRIYVCVTGNNDADLLEIGGKNTAAV